MTAPPAVATMTHRNDQIDGKIPPPSVIFRALGTMFNGGIYRSPCFIETLLRHKPKCLSPRIDWEDLKSEATGSIPECSLSDVLGDDLFRETYELIEYTFEV